MSTILEPKTLAKPQPRSVLGGARLRYVAEASRKTQLAEQWVRPPLHMSKTYQEKGWAISQLMSPTAGLLQGDVIEIDASVEAGGHAALISPAACRVHTMDAGHATVSQHYTVGENAVLDLWPAPLILQKDASLKQETTVELTTSSQVILCEIVSPGRVRFGETFTFTRWQSKLKIRREGKLLAYENFTVDPAKGGAEDWQQFSKNGTYASIYLLTAKPAVELIERLHALNIDDVYLGASALREGGIGIKILAGDGVGLRKSIGAVRSMLIEHMDTPYPWALQRAQTFFN